MKVGAVLAVVAALVIIAMTQIPEASAMHKTWHLAPAPASSRWMGGT